MKRRFQNASLPVRYLILSCLLLLHIWMGVRFVKAVQRISHLYDVNERLWQAAGEGRTALVKHLLAEGASANFSDAGFTVLQNAVNSDNPKTVEAVLRAGADASQISSGYAGGDHQGAIKVLLKKAGAME